MRLTRYRLRALARPARRWAAGLALASVTFALVHGAVGRAEAARARWGEQRSVRVATRDLQPGEPLAGATRQTDRPAAVVADDAIDGDRALDHERTAMAVLAGDVVRAGHLAGPAAATARGVADGRRVAALPRPDGLALAAGDRVDLLDAAGEVVAAGGVVVRVGDEAVEVSVDAAALGALARALADGRVVVVLSG